MLFEINAGATITNVNIRRGTSDDSEVSVDIKQRRQERRAGAADLSDADLSGADLSGAVLSGAYLSDADWIPRVENIHQAVFAAASAPRALDMGSWHVCETTHCRAGWVVHLAGAPGRVLEGCLGTPAAAALIYQASDPSLEKIPNFYCSNEAALADMKRLADAESAGKPEPPNRVASSAWLAAAQDIASEIYGGKLNMREVPTETFLVWWQWRQQTNPNSETGIPLKDFDIESVMMFFEDDVKAANT